MPGPAPKQNKQRRNKKSTSAELVADPNREVPPLPAFPPLPVKKDRETGAPLPPEPWLPLVRELWNDIWTGPTGGQYSAADVHGLLGIAVLYQRLYSTEDDEVYQKLVAEIRLQRRDFGLSPMSRASLNWEIANAAEAIEKQQERQNKRAALRERRRAAQIEARQELPPGDDGEEIVDAEVVPDPLAERELDALGG